MVSRSVKFYKVLVEGRKFGSVVLSYIHYILILFVRVSYLLFQYNKDVVYSVITRGFFLLYEDPTNMPPRVKCPILGPGMQKLV